MADAETAWSARCLARATRVATLATVADGQPYASLVTPAFAGDFSAILLLSSLSAHTGQLRAEPRCALLVAGNPTETNPQTAPRLSLTCRAELAPDPVLRQRFLAVHPYASLYADFGDFAIWRLTCLGGQLVGGFARADRLSAAELLPDAGAVTALAAAEPAILAHCNDHHADALAAIAGSGGDWRMATADVDGCDLACGETVRRVHWAQPVRDGGDVRAELVRLARVARAG